MTATTSQAADTRQAEAIRKVAFTMYPVGDMARARAFYEDTLGLTVSPTANSGGWIEYDLPGGGCFALTTYMEGVVPSASAGGCIAFEVENLVELLASLKAKGVTVRAEGIASPVCDMAVILDSEGNGILLHQLKQKAG